MFKQQAIGIFSSLAVIAALAFVPFESTTAAEPDGEPAAKVGMDELDYTPAKVTISEGETVRWKNSSRVPHTVTAIKEKANNPESVEIPSGAEPFGSGLMRPGDTFSHTFEVPGTYKYVCLPHEAKDMIGYVIVKSKE